MPMDSLGLENDLLESVVFGKTRVGTREEKVRKPQDEGRNSSLWSTKRSAD